jgi:MFS-type transporter involved in bile tolerance (Atg22 family)
MRQILLIVAGLCVFAVSAGVMVQFMPSPLKDTDYLVIGSVATLVALLVLFFTLISTTKSSNVFFKRRRK